MTLGRGPYLKALLAALILNAYSNSNPKHSPHGRLEIWVCLHGLVL
jgi:hypothetical protein